VMHNTSGNPPAHTHNRRRPRYYEC